MCIYYHGGKKRAADWIIDKFPPAFFFLDICGGGGTVSAADVDSRLYDFLTTVALRPRALEAFIRAWPLGRQSLLEIGKLINSENKLHRAAGVFLAINFNGHGIPADSVPDFLRPTYTTCSGGITRRNKLLREIAAAAKRLQDVNFENLDGILLYERYFGQFSAEDAPRSVIFLDPPYGDTIKYENTAFGLDECLKIFADKRAFVGVCYCPEEKLEAAAAQVIPFHNHLRGWNRISTFSHNLYLNFQLDNGPLFSQNP